MNDSVKSPSASHPVAARGNLYRAAIVGAASLKGKEVAEMLNERNFPAADIRLLDDDESMGQLEAMGDEISFIQRVRAEQFEHVDFTFFASDEEMHAQELERRPRRRQRHHRSLRRFGKRTRSQRAVAVGRARTRTNPRSGTAARPVRRGASGRGDAGASAVASPEGGCDPARRGHDFRTCFRARPARHGRVAPADREPAFVPASAQRCLRRAGRLQYDRALRAEVAARARFGRGSHRPPLSEDCRGRCSAAFAPAACRLPSSTATRWLSSWRWRAPSTCRPCRRPWPGIT